MRHYMVAIFCFVAVLANAQVRSYRGYYVNIQGDTVPGTVVYRTMMQLQDTLTFQSEAGVIKLLPNEIRGFGMHLGYDDFPYTDKKFITNENRRTYVGCLGVELDNIVGAAKTLPFGKTRVWLHFESVCLKKNDRVFLIRQGDAAVICIYTYYYTHIVFRGGSSKGSRLAHYTLSTVGLFGRSGNIIARGKKENQRKWVSRAIADYPLLSSMVLNKEFSHALSVDLASVVSEYNRWCTAKRITKSDTTSSPVFAGIADANKYNTKPIFLKTFAATSVAILPGLAAGGYYGSQRMKPVWPADCIYCKDKSYQNAYLFRAHAKKDKAILRAWKYGFVVAFGLILALAASE